MKNEFHCAWPFLSGRAIHGERRRLATPADVGWAAAFLASDAAAYISGASLEVHGGGEPPHYLATTTAIK